MTTARYFQDELEYLRKSGEEFAEYFPKLTDYLSSRSVDPDVERLLEGFAFLTGRLREKIDDQLPEVTQSLLQLLWPNFLRPVPSMTVMEFAPKPGAINERHVIEKGAQIESIPVDDTICKFRTCYDVEILPLEVDEVQHDVSKEASVVSIRLKTQSGEPIGAIGLKTLRLYLGGADYSAQMINLWVHRYLQMGELSAGSDRTVRLNNEQFVQAGLRKGEEVLPYPDNAFTGYRLLQEFFTLPQKYLFLDVCDLPIAALDPDADQVTLVLRFERPLPPDVRVTNSSFILHCVPAINLFEHDAEPILLTSKRSEYHVQPARRDAGEIEIFSIDQVTGWTPNPNAKSGGISREYSRFESFVHEIERVEGRTTVYFRERVKQAISGERLDRMISFVREDELSLIKVGETISSRLSCTNGTAPSELAVGDISIPAASVPSYVQPKNVIRPTVPRYPVVDGTLQWQLISALSLNYLSLQNVEALRTILHAFDFAARVDRQNERSALRRLEGLEHIHSQTSDRLFKGRPVRGMRSVLRIKESKFASEGEMFLFATVLAEFFALFATINSFHELEVEGLDAGEVYRWTARVGNQPLI